MKKNDFYKMDVADMVNYLCDHYDMDEVNDQCDEYVAELFEEYEEYEEALEDNQPIQILLDYAEDDEIKDFFWENVICALDAVA